MSRRKIIAELRAIAREHDGAGKLQRIFARLDSERITAYAETSNGSARLVAFHDAVVDADDTLEAVDRAVADGDLAEAGELIQQGRASLSERIEELKGLL